MIQLKNSVEREKKESEKKGLHFLEVKSTLFPSCPYTIEHMSLKIKPDFVNNVIIDCEQQITIRAFNDLSEIVLDISDLKVQKGKFTVYQYFKI